MTPAAFYLVASGALGACVGSFLNVCIYRLPREGLSPARPRRSFCPGCGGGVRALDNIPIVSWLLLGGRCRHCQAPISLRYLVVEALTSVLFVVAAARYLAVEEASFAAFGVVAALIAALIVASFIDLDLKILPDEITVGGMLLAPFLVVLAPEVHTRPVDATLSWALLSARDALEPVSAALPAALRSPGGALAVAAAGGAAWGLAGLFGYRSYWSLTRGGERRTIASCLLGGVIGLAAGGGVSLACVRPDLLLEPRVYSLWAALAGMLAGSSLVLVVGAVGSRVFRKPAMGFGDVKLMGLLGAFSGWVGVLAGFFLACLLGSVVGVYILLRHKSRHLPFGPFLALGSLSMILWPESIELLLLWYGSLFRV
jgi:leader peptidase (prepilin peptidase)/N-methyltransferase